MSSSEEVRSEMCVGGLANVEQMSKMEEQFIIVLSNVYLFIYLLQDCVANLIVSLKKFVVLSNYVYFAKLCQIKFSGCKNIKK